MGLFASTVSVAQEAHRLTKPNPTQSERQPMRLTPLGKSIVRKASNRTPRTIDPSVTLWGNATIDGEWGYYSFHPQSTGGKISFTQLRKQAQRIAKNGVQIADGKLYTVDFQRYGVGSGELTLYTYDLSTWEGSGKNYNDFSLAALETAQATDGTVYGEFYNSTASNQQYELGTVDYRTRKRTAFGTTTRKYVAMGITSDNRLYGIASDGILYKISTTDGVETKIGSTGPTPTSRYIVWRSYGNIGKWSGNNNMDSTYGRHSSRYTWCSDL